MPVYDPATSIGHNPQQEMPSSLFDDNSAAGGSNRPTRFFVFFCTFWVRSRKNDEHARIRGEGGFKRLRID